jgi:hypothetical protein
VHSLRSGPLPAGCTDALSCRRVSCQSGLSHRRAQRRDGVGRVLELTVDRRGVRADGRPERGGPRRWAASRRWAAARRSPGQGVTARVHRDRADGWARSPAARHASSRADICRPEAACAAASGATWRGSPARASCSAVEPLRTAACQPAARALAATRPASRPRPRASAAPSTNPHASPQACLALQARSTSAPPGGGAIAPTFPRPRMATTAWADAPHGPSHVSTDPTLDRHDSFTWPDAG